VAGSAHIITRVRTDRGWKLAADGMVGERRYIVRYRLGGRESKLRHGGSFATKKLAEARKRFLLEEMAAGRIPDLNPVRRLEHSPRVGDLVAAYIDSRRDVGPKTMENYGYAQRRISAHLRALPVATLTQDDVQRWVNDLDDDDKVGLVTTKQSLALLRAALDQAGVEPNPAARVRARSAARSRAARNVPGRKPNAGRSAGPAGIIPRTAAPTGTHRSPLVRPFVRSRRTRIRLPARSTSRPSSFDASPTRSPDPSMTQTRRAHLSIISRHTASSSSDDGGRISGLR